MRTSIKLGEVMLTRFNTGELLFDFDDIYSLPRDHPYAGKGARLSMFSYHFALPGRSVLIDPGTYDAKLIPPSMRIDSYQPPPSLAEQLRVAGIEASEITDVFISHAHFDHYNGLAVPGNGGYEPLFPRARHFLSRYDWQPQKFGPLEERTLGVVDEYGLLQLVEGAADLGDGLRILPAPGETPGHQVLIVESGDAVIWFGGDLYHHAIELSDDRLNVNWASAHDMRESKHRAMKRLAGSNAAAYFSHIDGACRVVAEDGGRLIWSVVS
jgi:glyoxylase-like metal-dependent hydrolase (beta-lactamase superfamily II)